MRYFPIYCPTKAALHSFSVALRAQLAGSNVSVTSLIPGYTDTELDKEFKERLVEMQGGPAKAIKPVPLQEFIEDAMKSLDGLEDGKARNEIAIGQFPEMIQGKWREAFGPVLGMFGVQG